MTPPALRKLKVGAPSSTKPALLSGLLLQARNALPRVRPLASGTQRVLAEMQTSPLLAGLSEKGAG